MKRRIKQTIAYVLSAVLIAGLFSFAMPIFSIKVKAVESKKTVASLSTDAIKNPTHPSDGDDPWKGNYVWYGKYEGEPVKYRVLDNDTTEFNDNKSLHTLFLDCDSILFNSVFWDNLAYYSRFDAYSFSGSYL